jgi:glutamyl/glutaminyl-tRNA synthetase
VQGEVSFQRRHLEDLVLMRSDGTPLYNLAVVVDDHDMGVTHVIRGDDHLTNTFKQALIYDAMGWRRPTFAHVPLIFGPDGKKLSKRHGATATADYQAMGYLAAGMRNYLARLGWSHGDMEVFSDAEARGAFDLPGINKAPARFDFKKLESLSGEHMRRAEERALLAELDAFLAATSQPPVPAPSRERVLAALPFAKAKAKTFPQLLEQLRFALADRPLDLAPEAGKALDAASRDALRDLTPHLRTATWERGISLFLLAQTLDRSVGAPLAGERMPRSQVAVRRCGVKSRKASRDAASSALPASGARSSGRSASAKRSCSRSWGKVLAFALAKGRAARTRSRDGAGTGGWLVPRGRRRARPEARAPRRVACARPTGFRAS